MIAQSVLYGIVVLLLYSVGAFLIVRPLKREGSVKALVASQIGAVIPSVIYLAFFGPSLSISTYYLLLCLAAGALAAGSGYFGFKSIEAERVSLVYPISGAWAVVTTPLAILLLHEVLNITEAIGVAIIIFGLLLASLSLISIKKLSVKLSSKAVEYSILSMLFSGGVMFLVGFVSQKAGWFLPVLIVIIIEGAFYAAYLVHKRSNLKMPARSILPLLIAGVLAGIAFLIYSVGSQSGTIAIIAPLASAAPIGTIILAYLFLKERLNAGELIGVLLLIGGIVLLSI